MTRGRPSGYNEKLRRQVRTRDGNLCHYCGIRLVEREEMIPQSSPAGGWWLSCPVGTRGACLDHVRPRCLGGSDDMENLVLACAPCNRRKGMKYPYEQATA